jgi:hypothetical protein
VEFVEHLGGSEQEGLLPWTRWNEVVIVSICVGGNRRLVENKGVCILGGGGGSDVCLGIQHFSVGYFSTLITCRCNCWPFTRSQPLAAIKSNWTADGARRQAAR